ncbi:MAG: tyrosine-type recombinase/integrase [Verrucomicrobiales bacterium]|nr:tyrosine-type recombinase/integrase [Verrucomicrobiales bacterium]
MLLTDSKIKTSKAGSKCIRLKDGNGLFLTIRSNGKKFWQFRYRFLDKEKTLSFGRYPQISIAQARELRFEARRTLAKGIDPSAVKRKEKAVAVFRDRNTFGAITEEWLKLQEVKWSPNYLKKTLCRINNHLLPELKNRPVTSIEPLDLLAVLQKIESKGCKEMSHRVLRIAGAILDYAIITGRTKQNITTGLSKALQPYSQTHYPTLGANELPAFIIDLENLDTSEQNLIAFKLLMLTAVRTGELRTAKWIHINLNGREWRIPAENTKMRTEHVVPLSSQSMGLLNELRDISGDSEWLFPNSRKQVHPVMSENTINNMIHRMGYKGRIVGHGFRSMFSTILNENGFNRDAIERQLAHMERNKVRAAYNRAEYLPERREMMQWWADFIDSGNVRTIPVRFGQKKVADSLVTEKELDYSGNLLFPLNGATLH